ncbi:transposase [Streptosporangium canum]|uniref:transposase n=1 Tax=Streptosporangium canum TaxID=324952 RepID=UPI00367DC9CC
MKNYPPEFKADAVALVSSRPERTITSIARDLGVSHETPVRSPPTGPAVRSSAPAPRWPTPCSPPHPREAGCSVTTVRGGTSRSAESGITAPGVPGVVDGPVHRPGGPGR